MAASYARFPPASTAPTWRMPRVGMRSIEAEILLLWQALHCCLTGKACAPICIQTGTFSESKGERVPAEHEVAGSIPARRTPIQA